MIARAVAARAQAGQPNAADIEVCWLTNPGKSAFGDTSREDAMAKIRQLAPDDLLVFTWLGTAHNIMGLLEHEQPFSLAETVDGPVAAPPGIEIIPLSLMRAMLDDWIRAEEVIHRCCDMALCSMVHMMAPPPKEHVKMRAKLDEGQEKAGEVKFAAAPGRLALWKLEAALIRRYLAGLGVRPYDHPAGTTEAGGFLAPAYQAPDATHANIAYGELCLKDFESILGAAQQSGTTP